MELEHVVFIIKKSHLYEGEWVIKTPTQCDKKLTGCS